MANFIPITWVEDNIPAISAANLQRYDNALDGTDALTAVDINGGSINGTPIGAAAASTGVFSSATINGGAVNSTPVGLTTRANAAFVSVGIGTGSPNYPLQIEGGGSNSYLQFTNTATGGASNNGFVVGAVTGGDAFLYHFGNFNMRFFTNNAERMRIAADGKVNIGTTTSSYSIHVHNSAGDAYSHYTTTATGQTSSDGFVVGSTSAGAGLIWNYEAQPIRFATSGAERMTILGNGNVGFGDTNPFGSFHITQSTFGSGNPSNFPVLALRNDSVTTNNCKLNLMSGTIGSSAIELGDKDASALSRITHSNATNDLAFSTNNGIKMTLSSTGNLGFGTTNQFGSGVKVIGISNATTTPSTNPFGGGVLYVTGGALHYRGSGGLDTLIAASV